MKCSIVIPSYNSEATIRKCLDSLVKQDYRGKYEIIVVDSSSDDTYNIIKKEFPSVRVVRLNKQTLPGKGRNIGIDNAEGEIICFIDTDCIADKSWLSNMVKAHGKYNIVGGSVDNANPSSLIGWLSYISEFSELISGKGGKKKEVRNLASCNISYKKKILTKYGGFPTDIWPGEDRVHIWDVSRNEKVLFDPNVKIAHWNRSSLKRFFKHQYRLGFSAAQARKIADLPGQVLVKYPILALFIPFKKTLFVGFKMLSLGIGFFIRFIILSPLFFIGTLVWTYGFVKGARAGRGN